MDNLTIERANSQEASLVTLLRVQMFGVETHEVWTKPNHSYVVKWRGKSYLITRRLRSFVHLATVTLIAAFASIALTVLTNI